VISSHHIDVERRITDACISLGGNGFQISAPRYYGSPAHVYVGGWISRGKLTASLSDGSAPDYVDSSVSESASMTAYTPDL